jgi:hypothetical protein
MTLVTQFSRLFAGLAVASLAVLGVQVVQAQDGHLREQMQLKQTRACENCDLSGVAFKDELKGVNLTGANLEGASFYRLDLTNANFGGANLTKANLSMTNLTNTNLGDANLAGANLAGSTGAAIAGARTTETTTCPDGQTGPCR